MKSSAAERDERERQHQRRIEEKRETVAVGSEQMPEKVHDKGTDHHGQIVHRHHERQRQRRRARRSDRRRLVVNDGLDHAVAEARAQNPDDEHRLVAENTHAEQPGADQCERDEIDAARQPPDNLVDEESPAP